MATAYSRPIDIYMLYCTGEVSLVAKTDRISVQARILIAARRPSAALGCFTRAEERGVTPNGCVMNRRSRRKVDAIVTLNRHALGSSLTTTSHGLMEPGPPLLRAEKKGDGVRGLGGRHPHRVSVAQ